jgi:PBP1b-binding outer membrane lipoprotein LpoB
MKIILPLIFFLAILFSGCSQKDANSSQTSSKDEIEEVKKVDFIKKTDKERADSFLKVMKEKMNNSNTGE